MNMGTKRTCTITLDKKIAEESQRILSEFGMNRSSFIEIMLKALVDSEVKPMGEVYGPLFERIEKYARAKKKKEKND